LRQLAFPIPDLHHKSGNAVPVLVTLLGQSGDDADGSVLAVKTGGQFLPALSQTLLQHMGLEDEGIELALQFLHKGRDAVLRG
jgi:hypothetical protein